MRFNFPNEALPPSGASHVPPYKTTTILIVFIARCVGTRLRFALITFHLLVLLLSIIGSNDIVVAYFKRQLPHDHEFATRRARVSWNTGAPSLLLRYIRSSMRQWRENPTLSPRLFARDLLPCHVLQVRDDLIKLRLTQAGGIECRHHTRAPVAHALRIAHQLP